MADDTGTDALLRERQGTHGEFSENSRSTWEIMRVLMSERNWPNLRDEERHALYMISHKMGRIMAGDPRAQDHWDDIAGYAKLVSSRIGSPVQPYTMDMYAALAVGWNCTREEAKRRAHKEGYSQQPPTDGRGPTSHIPELLKKASS